MRYKSKAVRKIARNAFQGVFFLATYLLLPTTSSAQSPVNVTATVKDSAGIPYSNATVSILLIPTGTAPTVGGAQISGTNNGQLDVNGKLNVSLYKNTDIVPASSQWQFTICETPGVAPPLGTGGQCFTSSQTVSAAVDFSTQFQAAAKALSTVTLGAGSVTHTGGALTANLPVIGAGGADIAVGTRTGNTTLFPTFTGAATPARCVDTDASGNLQVISTDCNTAAFGPNYSIGGGIAQAQTVAPTTAVTNVTLVNGYQICWIPNASNNAAAPTLAGSGTSTFSAKPITKYPGTSALVSGDISTNGSIACAEYDGTEFQLLNPQTGWATGVIPRSQTTTSDTIAATDRGNGIIENNAGAIAVALGQAGVAPLDANFFFFLKDIGAGTSTITPGGTSQIAGNNGTLGATLAVTTGQTAYCYSNNSDYQCTVVSGSGAALSNLTAATGANTIANGNNPQTWNWAQTTDSQSGMAFGETSAATGGTFLNAFANQAVQKISTAANSTAAPLSIVQGAISNAVTTPPALQMQTTWNNAGLTGQGIVFNVTDTASVAGNLLDLQKGGTSQFRVRKDGTLFLSGAGQFFSTTPNLNMGPNSGGSGYTIMNSGSAHSAHVAVASSATPAFALNTGNVFVNTLTANVTGATLSSLQDSEIEYFDLCQDGTGGRTFVWPTQMLNPPAIHLTASLCRTYPFTYDGTKFYYAGGSPTAGQAVLGSDYTNATTTLSDVTGLALELNPSQNYAISCKLIYQGSAATASLVLSSTGPASPTKVTAQTLMDTTTGAGGAVYIAATDGTTFGFTLGPTALVTTATDLYSTLDVGIQNGANIGIFQLQAKANGAGTVTIKQGSYCTSQ